MKIANLGVAGTMESSDIIVRIEPKEGAGVELELESSVKQQFGKQIEKVIRETLSDLGVDAARVSAVDKGALDCTVRARVSCAVYRAAGNGNYSWEVKHSDKA